LSARLRRWGASIGVCVALAAAGTGCAMPAMAPTASSTHAPKLHGDAVWAATAKAAPNFRLTNQRGEQVSLASMRGHVVLLTFLDSLCKTDCPIEGGMLHRIQRLIPATARPEIVVVSVDPADTPATSRRFVREAGIQPPWQWLRGSPHQLAKVWRAYGITVIPKAGDIAHSTVLYLIDSHGYERAGYLFPFQVPQVAEDVRSLSPARVRG
jgi:cytochrome oxidase Cu insertion factor (SCO1/SenC/PrrC family)